MGVQDRSRFDQGAATTDNRVGIPTPVPQKIAEAIQCRCNASPTSRVVEIGPGTGQIGEQLLKRFSKYVGLDSSARMIERFRERVGDGPDLRLVEANNTWPLADASVDVVFASRAMHLIEPAHMISEFERVTRSGAALITGAVRRDPELHVGAALRREIRQRLKDSGILVPERSAAERRVFDGLLDTGNCLMIPPAEVASWDVQLLPSDIIAHWRRDARWGDRRSTGFYWT